MNNVVFGSTADEFLNVCETYVQGKIAMLSNYASNIELLLARLLQSILFAFGSNKYDEFESWLKHLLTNWSSQGIRFPFGLQAIITVSACTTNCKLASFPSK